MKLQEIAARISAHLKRFEADPKINTGGKKASRKSSKERSDV